MRHLSLAITLTTALACSGNSTVSDAERRTIVDSLTRQVKAAYELPQDIDVAASEAKLENGVLSLKLGKQVPVSNVAQLAIN